MSKFIYYICRCFRLSCFKKKNKIGILEIKNLKQTKQNIENKSQNDYKERTITTDNSIDSFDTLLNHFKKYDPKRNVTPFPKNNPYPCTKINNKTNQINNYDEILFNDVFIDNLQYNNNCNYNYDDHKFKNENKIKEQKWIEYINNRKHNYKWLKNNSHFDYSKESIENILLKDKFRKLNRKYKNTVNNIKINNFIQN